MKKLAFTLILVISSTLLLAQFGCTCLPEGITFSTQAQIDNFQTDYPSCTEIEGDMKIDGDGITNLNGLSVLTSIGGNLIIGYYYSGNPNLTSLTGLDNLTSIGGNLYIFWNESLTSLSGLDSLAAIGGDLDIYWNESLTGLSGLDSLAAIGGDLYIRGNHALSLCGLPGLCDYLSNPNGAVSIYGNAPGCNSPPEIADACGITLPCLPYGNYFFYGQNDVDNFQANYPGCTDLEGNVIIAYSWRFSPGRIVNLYGLNVVTSISGNLYIAGNDTLTSLTGLDNLDSIGENLDISFNDSLTSLSGLDNLTTIGGNLLIKRNDSLTSLLGLDNLTTIGGSVSIGALDYLGRPFGNRALTNLTGLDNLVSIGVDLSIYGNNLLTSSAFIK